MKILFALLAFAPTLAFGSPSLPEAGKYTFRDFTVVQLRRAEMVRTNTQAGRARLQELRGVGAECVLKGPELVRCLSFEKTEGSEDEVEEEVSQQMSGVELSFGEPEGVPSQTVNAPTYEEWLSPQGAKFFGKAWPNFRIMRLRGGVDKFVFGNPTEFSVVVRVDGFGYLLTLQRQVHRDVVLTYLVEARLTN